MILVLALASLAAAAGVAFGLACRLEARARRELVRVEALALAEHLVELHVRLGNIVELLRLQGAARL